VGQHYKITWSLDNNQHPNVINVIIVIILTE
jgi:hypothetical protein